MKKSVLLLILCCFVCTGLFAKKSIYVSAAGSDDEYNMGLTERKPVKTLDRALLCAIVTKRNIMVLGTLDANSEGKNGSHVFLINLSYRLRDVSGTSIGEILITGKPGATGTKRAVLSGKGSGKPVVNVRDLQVRFEHIEISGSEGEKNDGLDIRDGAQVTLGPGAVVCNNSYRGMYIYAGGTCIIDGGEVSRNNHGGVSNKGNLTLQNGSIKDNVTPFSGGGVGILKDGHFTMSGGTISGNRTGTSKTYLGGGVQIAQGGRFTMSGGTITNNRAQGGGGGVGIGGRSESDESDNDTVTLDPTEKDSGSVEKAIFTMTGGSITNNTAQNIGGGVSVNFGGSFDQTGGSISNNKADAVGGVFVEGGERYNKTGGTVSGNTAPNYLAERLSGSDDNITRMPSSLGSGR